MATPVRGQRKSAQSGLSLLEKLRLDDLQEPHGNVGIQEAKFRSIKTNIVRILNGRKGGSESTPGFGLGDLNDAASGKADTLDTIALDIRRALEAHEPRVSNVTVGFDRSQGMGITMNFNVSVTTKIGSNEEQLLLDLVLTEGRSFILR